eukprot:Colp12_sorted_trinity150504_noHs@4031
MAYAALNFFTQRLRSGEDWRSHRPEPVYFLGILNEPLSPFDVDHKHPDSNVVKRPLLKASMRFDHDPELDFTTPQLLTVALLQLPYGAQAYKSGDKNDVNKWCYFLSNSQMYGNLSEEFAQPHFKRIAQLCNFMHMSPREKLLCLTRHGQKTKVEEEDEPTDSDINGIYMDAQETDKFFKDLSSNYRKRR